MQPVLDFGSESVVKLLIMTGSVSEEHAVPEDKEREN